MCIFLVFDLTVDFVCSWYNGFFAGLVERVDGGGRVLGCLKRVAGARQD